MSSCMCVNTCTLYLHVVVCDTSGLQIVHVFQPIFIVDEINILPLEVEPFVFSDKFYFRQENLCCFVLLSFIFFA